MHLQKKISDHCIENDVVLKYYSSIGYFVCIKTAMEFLM